MLNLEGINNIRKTTWRNLRPGMIVLQGFTINDKALPELYDYPILTIGLVQQLFTRYKLLHNRELIVADIQPGFPPDEISDQIIDNKRKLISLNSLRRDLSKEKRKILEELNLPPDLEIPLLGTDYVEKDFLIKDTYSSFSSLYGLGSHRTAIPSFFENLDLVLSLGDILANKLTNKFNLPEDNEVMLHLVVDYSRSMESAGKLSIVLSAINFFHTLITGSLEKTKIQLYTFSDICRPAVYPLTGGEMKGGETNYSSFMKKVLHLRDRDIYNKVILFTDGKPSDRTETLKIAALFKKNKVDYTQLIFAIKEEQREEILINGEFDHSLAVDSIINNKDMKDNMSSKLLNNEELELKLNRIFDEFTEIAEAAGGNQVIVKINSLMKMISIECYDRYMGLLTQSGVS